MERRSFFELTDRENGEIDLFWMRVDGSTLVPRAFARPLPFANPITRDDRFELQWYLERFLQRPLAPERGRARRAFDIWPLH